MSPRPAPCAALVSNDRQLIYDLKHRVVDDQVREEARRIVGTPL